ncbi:hypothetical protein MAIT1_00197 [Magnetofaba australis IT-1]|uniref:Uncharacterized protein n=1 Tax=Magnetofaba australis IT-1 TaxID=1434232 RepID=A0A1Y2K8G4_9PROT|nr:hypothetical protein MAIT1_00197 [Magnetofaba australis IT-1]
MAFCQYLPPTRTKTIPGRAAPGAAPTRAAPAGTAPTAGIPAVVAQTVAPAIGPTAPIDIGVDVEFEVAPAVAVAPAVTPAVAIAPTGTAPGTTAPTGTVPGTAPPRFGVGRGRSHRQTHHRRQNQRTAALLHAQSSCCLSVMLLQPRKSGCSLSACALISQSLHSPAPGPILSPRLTPAPIVPRRAVHVPFAEGELPAPPTAPGLLIAAKAVQPFARFALQRRNIRPRRRETEAGPAKRIAATAIGLKPAIAVAPTKSRVAPTARPPVGVGALVRQIPLGGRIPIPGVYRVASTLRRITIALAVPAFRVSTVSVIIARSITKTSIIIWLRAIIWRAIALLVGSVTTTPAALRDIAAARCAIALGAVIASHGRIASALLAPLAGLRRITTIFIAAIGAGIAALTAIGLGIPALTAIPIPTRRVIAIRISGRVTRISRGAALGIAVAVEPLLEIAHEATELTSKTITGGRHTVGVIHESLRLTGRIHIRHHAHASAVTLLNRRAETHSYSEHQRSAMTVQTQPSPMNRANIMKP